MTLTGNATEIFQTLFGIFRDARLQLDITFSVIPAVPAVVEPEPEPEPVEPPLPSPAEPGKINLNTCVFGDLRKIGVSPNIAANIIQAKPFKKTEDLLLVPGVTRNLFNILREKVSVVDEV